MKPCAFVVDRSMMVPEGFIVQTTYADVDDVVLDCKDRMSVGDVKDAYHKLLQLGSEAMWPCPVGYWRGDRFHITDGRHQYIATLMLGRTHMLVAWLQEP